MEAAKSEATKNLVAQQEQYVQSAIRDEVQRREPRDGKERQLVEQFRNDPELKNFVTGQRQFLKITYEDDEDVRAAFVKACLSRENVVAYQKERLQKITTKLSKNRAESAFGELEARLNQAELDLNTPTEFDSAASKSKTHLKNWIRRLACRATSRFLLNQLLFKSIFPQLTIANPSN